MFNKFKNLIKLKELVVKKRQFLMSGSVLKGSVMEVNGSSSAAPFVVVSTVDPSAVPLAKELLTAGEVIALPTDTVYGLACDATNPRAIQKLNQIKGRGEKKRVGICVAEIEDFHHWGCADHLPREMLGELLPGAVTLIVKKSPRLDNPHLNPGVATIGIRIPDFDFIREVSRLFRLPIALTSANKSGEPSSLTISEFQPLWPLLGAVFDGGQLGVTEAQRAASTVVDLSHRGSFSVVREGVAMQKTENILNKYKIFQKNKV